MKIEEKVKTDFSDWLVASDIDGTLNNKLRRLPKRNYDRICEFVLEKKRPFYARFRPQRQFYAQAVPKPADSVHAGDYFKRRRAL